MLILLCQDPMTSELYWSEKEEKERKKKEEEGKGREGKKKR